MCRSIIGVHYRSKLDLLVISQGASVMIFLENTTSPAVHVLFCKDLSKILFYSSKCDVVLIQQLDEFLLSYVYKKEWLCLSTTEIFLPICFGEFFSNITDIIRQNFDGDSDKSIRVQTAIKTSGRF